MNNKGLIYFNYNSHQNYCQDSQELQYPQQDQDKTMGFQYPKTINKIHNISIIHKRIKVRQDKMGFQYPKTRLRITKIQSLQARATKTHKITSQGHQNPQYNQDNQVQDVLNAFRIGFDHSLYVQVQQSSQNNVFSNFSCLSSISLEAKSPGPLQYTRYSYWLQLPAFRGFQTIAFLPYCPGTGYILQKAEIYNI